MMNFLKDWIIQYKNKFSVGGVETTIDRVTGTVSQEGDKIKACYLNEIQKNCIYQVNATRVIEGVLEIYDISIDGSEEFAPFNQTFLIDFDVTNTQVDSLLRFNGITYSLRFSDSVTNGDIAPKIGDISKRALIKLDVLNSKALILDVKPSILYSPEFLGIPKAPTAPAGSVGTQLANLDFVNAMLGGNTVPAKAFNPSGYVKMANGLILQWGVLGSPGRTSTTVTFPIAFPTACLNAQMTLVVANTSDWWTGTVGAVTKTTLAIYDHMGSGSIYWFAIGY